MTLQIGQNQAGTKQAVTHRRWVFNFGGLLIISLILSIVFAFEFVIFNSVEGYDIEWEASCSPVSYNISDHHNVFITFACGKNDITLVDNVLAVQLLRDPHRKITCRELIGQILHDMHIKCEVTD